MTSDKFEEIWGHFLDGWEGVDSSTVDECIPQIRQYIDDLRNDLKVTAKQCDEAETRLDAVRAAGAHAAECASRMGPPVPCDCSRAGAMLRALDGDTPTPPSVDGETLVRRACAMARRGWVRMKEPPFAPMREDEIVATLLDTGAGDGERRCRLSIHSVPTAMPCCTPTPEDGGRVTDHMGKKNARAIRTSATTTKPEQDNGE